MSVHAIYNNKDTDCKDQSLISLVSLDTNAGNLIIDVCLAESLLGLNLKDFIQNRISNSSSNPKPSFATKPKVIDVDAANEASNIDRPKEALSTAMKEHIVEGRKGARLLRKLASKGTNNIKRIRKSHALWESPTLYCNIPSIFIIKD